MVVAATTASSGRLVDKVELRAQDVVVVDGRIGGRALGDLVVVDGQLVRSGSSAPLCARCEEPRVSVVRTRIGWQPQCREHAYVGQWITADERRLKISELRTAGASAGAIASWVRYALRRSPG